jgi:NTE family protein
MKKILILLLLFIYTFFIFSQSRPKVALVLSGGGAKGFAHIGVIKELEKAGIKPDIITGTSMGSIVGALYSIGYTVEQMEQIAIHSDWDNIISNKLPFNKVAIEEKPYDSRYFAEFGFEDKQIQLPKGMIEGKELALMIDKLTIPAHGINDFHDFPIPFACVATDITNGEAVVLDKGNINEALRASMAIPSVFTPVKIDGRLLVDGGLVRNFPVQQALDMGADIVIGVFVSGDFYKEDELNSLVDVLSQSAFVLSTFDSREQKKLCDYVVEPNLKGFGTADFLMGEPIINRGKIMAEKFIDVFKKLADSLSHFDHQETRPSLLVVDSFDITKIEITGNSKIPNNIISRKIDFNKQKTYTTQQVVDHMTVLYGTKSFSKVNFNLIPNSDSSYVIRVKVEENYDVMFKSAVHFDSENGTGLNINLTFRNVLIPYSRFIIEGDIATSPRIDLNYLVYVGKRQNKFFAFDGNWSKVDLPIYNDKGQKSSLWNSHLFNVNAQINYTIGTNLLIGGEAGMSWLQLNPEINEGSFKGYTFIQEAIPYIRAKTTYNTLNKRFFPNKGVNLEISATYTNSLIMNVTFEDSTSIYNQSLKNDQVSINLRHRYVIPVNQKISFSWYNNINMIFTNAESFSTTTFVGGYNPLYFNTISFLGAKAYEFNLSNVYTTQLDTQWEFIKKTYLITSINYAESEIPFKYIPNQDFDNKLGDQYRRLSFGLALAYNSPIGPISFAVARDINKSHFTTNFSLGFWYK